MVVNKKFNLKFVLIIELKCLNKSKHKNQTLNNCILKESYVVDAA